MLNFSFNTHCARTEWVPYCSYTSFSFSSWYKECLNKVFTTKGVFINKEYYQNLKPIITVVLFLIGALITPKKQIECLKMSAKKMKGMSINQEPR